VLALELVSLSGAAPSAPRPFSATETDMTDKQDERPDDPKFAARGEVYMSLPARRFCKGEHATWGYVHFWTYSDGTASLCDESGNHEDIDPNDIPSVACHAEAWREYHEWVRDNGQDPLREFIRVKHTKRVQEVWHVVMAPSIVGPMAVLARHGRGRYVGSGLPEHVRQFLHLDENGRSTFAQNWAELREMIPEVKMRRYTRFVIEHNKPRSPAAIARELRREARRVLSRSKP